MGMKDERGREGEGREVGEDQGAADDKSDLVPGSILAMIIPSVGLGQRRGPASMLEMTSVHGDVCGEYESDPILFLSR